MEGLKLYIWDGLSLEAPAMAIVLAHNEEEAKELLEDEYGALSDKEKEAKPEIYECPNAFVYWFD